MEKKRHFFDWERIEAEYRAGVLSLREIARNHGCSDTAIRRKAKALSWDRDLSEKIEKEVRNKLVRSVRKAGSSDHEVVEAAAEFQVGIELAQRKDLAHLREMEEKLLADLGGEDVDEPKKLYITQYQGQIVQKEVGLTVAEKASALLALANVRARRIELERRIYNLDGDRDDKDKGEGLAGLIAEIHANAKRGLPCEGR